MRLMKRFAGCAMRCVGEMVVYGSNGVMEIVDIREEVVVDVARKYYVLRAVGTRGESLTFVPVDNEKLVSMMRPLLTREEIIEIIHSADELSEPEWVGDNRLRTERFKKIIDSGNRADIIALIRLIYKAGQRRAEEGKKNFLSDENLMHKAEKLIASEFSIVLGIPEEDVPEFIAKEIG